MISYSKTSDSGPRAKERLLSLSTTIPGDPAKFFIMSDRTYQSAQTNSDARSGGLITLTEGALASRRRIVAKSGTKDRFGDQLVVSLRARLAGTKEDEKNGFVAEQLAPNQIS